jgi:hypothetical protein
MYIRNRGIANSRHAEDRYHFINGRSVSAAIFSRALSVRAREIRIGTRRFAPFQSFYCLFARIEREKSDLSRFGRRSIPLPAAGDKEDYLWHG